MSDTIPSLTAEVTRLDRLPDNSALTAAIY